nr:flippase-like domain-containing protein [Ilumatobacteraceae bacterium]
IAAVSHRLDARWRRAAWVAFGIVAVCRVLTATEAPLNLVAVLLVGTASGSLALVVLGAPIRPQLPDDAAALLVDRDIDPGAVHVRFVGRDERDTGLLVGWWRAARVKGFGDQRPARTPEREVENEALAMSLAAAAGARVPHLAGVAVTPDGDGVIAYERVDGPTLATDPDPDELGEVWRQVGALRRQRIAHGDLRLERVRRGPDGPVLTGFARARVHAANLPLGADVANLLVSSAAVVGVDRAAAAAVEGVGADAVAHALPLVQEVVLSPAVRRVAKEHPGLLAEVRRAGAECCGVEPVEPAPVRRISVKGVVALAGGLVLGAYVLSLLANWSDIWAALQDADPSVIPWLVIWVVLSYVGGSLSLMGSVTVDLPFLRTTEVMFGQSFLNRFTPANAGGMAMRVRYLQLNGVDLAVGSAAVGLTSVASGVMQAVFLVVFLVWGGRSDELGRFDLPDAGGLVIVVLAVAAVGGVLVLSSWGRRVVVPKVRGVLAKVRSSFGELLRRPDRLGLLFGGAAMAKAVTLFAFVVSVHAFDVDMGFAQAGALYMVANTIGSAVPTPGGVGGIEAALTAALVGAGVDPATAAAIVVLFRFATFWAPTLPGWFFLQHAQRTGVV